MLWETFMSICLLTTLECDNIDVRYGYTGYDGMAIRRGGELSIIIQPQIRNEASVLAHEIAHLVEFKKGNYSHDYRFFLTCKDLSELAEVKGVCYE